MRGEGREPKIILIENPEENLRTFFWSFWGYTDTKIIMKLSENFKETESEFEDVL